MKKIYGIAFATALMALASCSSDAPEINEPINDGPAAGFLKLSFEGIDAGTRAESGINNVTFIFKSAAGTETVTVNATQTDATKGNHFISNANDKAAVVVKVNNIPTSVTAVVNAGGATYTSTIEDDHQASAFTDNVCSSAMYKGASGATNETPLTGVTIYKTAQDAAASDASYATIYVDRLYAKVNLTVSATGDKLKLAKGFTDGNKDIAIEFVPKIAFINGVATSTTLFKGLNTSAQGQTFADGILYTNTDAQTMSHWAAATGHAWNQTQHYAVTGDKAAKLDRKVSYIYENTPATAGATKNFTHVIVAGKYKLDNKEVTTTFWTFGTKNNVPVVYTDQAKLLEAMHASSYEDLEDITTNEIKDGETVVTKSVIGKQYGGLVCQEYKDGWVYYAVPIHHFTIEGQGENASTKYVNGIVRNHEYHIDVQGITSYGTALSNPEDPIIPEDPEKENTNYNLQLKIVVNPFAQVPNQNINW